jgi:hypothetical protein
VTASNFRAFQSAEPSQYRGLVQRDVIRGGALDFIDGIVGTGTMNVAAPIHIVPMHLDDFSADSSGFRIPADAITDLKRLDHHQCWPCSAPASVIG